MDRWLVGLAVAAIVLPLIIFVGNLKTEAIEVPEGGGEGLESTATDEAVVQEENAPAQVAIPEINFGYSHARVNLGNEQGFRPTEVVTYAAPESYTNLTPNIPYV